MVFTCLLLVCSMFLCTAQSAQTTSTTFPARKQFKEARLSYRITPAMNHTWGYDILKEGHLFIHRTNIPGMKVSILITSHFKNKN